MKNKKYVIGIIVVIIALATVVYQTDINSAQMKAVVETPMLASAYIERIHVEEVVKEEEQEEYAPVVELIIHRGAPVVVEEPVQVHVPAAPPVVTGRQCQSYRSDAYAHYAATRMAALTGQSYCFWSNLIRLESGNRPFVSGGTGSRHFGFFQINVNIHSGRGAYVGMNVSRQVDVAYQIYRGQGIRAWSVWQRALSMCE